MLGGGKKKSRETVESLWYRHRCIISLSFALVVARFMLVHFTHDYESEPKGYCNRKRMSSVPLASHPLHSPQTAVACPIRGHHPRPWRWMRLGPEERWLQQPVPALPERERRAQT